MIQTIYDVSFVSSVHRDSICQPVFWNIVIHIPHDTDETEDDDEFYWSRIQHSVSFDTFSAVCDVYIYVCTI